MGNTYYKTIRGRRYRCYTSDTEHKEVCFPVKESSSRRKPLAQKPLTKEEMGIKEGDEEELQREENDEQEQTYADLILKKLSKLEDRILGLPDEEDIAMEVLEKLPKVRKDILMVFIKAEKYDKILKQRRMRQWKHQNKRRKKS